MTTNHTYWTTANQVCSPRQLQALQLLNQGLTQPTISLHMGISRERVGQLIRRANQLIELQQRKEHAA